MYSVADAFDNQSVYMIAITAGLAVGVFFFHKCLGLSVVVNIQSHAWLRTCCDLHPL